MKRASGIGHLTPFLPGLGALLEDPEVSEIMINGPGNVWVERAGKLEPHEAPGLTAAWLHRAAIHIARPLGLDPAARPILDARLGDGSRVAICTPPAAPEVAITIRRFGGGRSRPKISCAWVRCRRMSCAKPRGCSAPAGTSSSPGGPVRGRPRS